MYTAILLIFLRTSFLLIVAQQMASRRTKNNGRSFRLFDYTSPPAYIAVCISYICFHGRPGGRCTISLTPYIGSKYYRKTKQSKTLIFKCV